MSYPIPQNGYLTHFLYTGRRESPFSCDERDTNQLQLEKKLRTAAATHAPLTPPQQITVGAPSPLGVPWKYYYSFGNIFLDDSSFYVELCRVDLHAAAVLNAPRAMQVQACLWSYDAVDVWLNGSPAGTIERPVYKPIQRRLLTLDLQPGANTLYLRLETMGVRDTRVAVAFQLLGDTHELTADVPDAAACAAYTAAAALADTARLQGDRLLLQGPLPAGARLRCYTGQFDYRKKDDRFRFVEADGLSKIALPPYAAFSLEIPVGDTTISRFFERTELEGPRCLDVPVQPGRRELQEKIAQVASLFREETDGFAMYPMLARRYLGQDTAADREELCVTLGQIERRMDCADFMTTGLIRLMREYGLPDDLRAEVHRVMLGFRYWMDEQGQDCMCFWSENHTLMFFQTAYFFGEEYPDEIFARSGKTGRQLRAAARVRLQEWLHDVTTEGFDEFNSTVYTPITFAALLNLVDYAEPELADLAAQACDLLWRRMAMHCFKGIVISPMGRVYRGVLTPWRESLQAMVHYIDPTAPYVYNEWLSALATTRYQIPDDLTELMHRTGSFSYSTGNALVQACKTDDYMLTSVQSPRRDGVARVWQADEREEMRSHFCYVKSLNEHFHGTTQIEPGVHGYQQHLWSAALATDLVVFANHPGQSCDTATEVRPGYWYGNGVMPALLQKQNVLGAVYCIPQDDPIRFVHLYWDAKKFDQTQYDGGWLLGRRGDSYLGIWCSAPLTDHDDALVGCEKRADTPCSGWLVVCGSKTGHGSFAAFAEACRAQSPAFDGATLQSAALTLTFTAHENRSQIVD